MEQGGAKTAACNQYTTDDRYETEFNDHAGSDAGALLDGNITIL